MVALRKLALKKLKSSDLSFFKSYLSEHPQTKQKGLNLDLRIIEGEFFPSLRVSLEPLHKKAAHVDLTMYGPGVTDAHTLARKVKRDAKNIRLNGEIVDNPVTDPTRYDVLCPGDFAVMEFVGAALPTSVNIVLVASKHPDDESLHTALEPILPLVNDSMKILTEFELENIINAAKPTESHPIRDWLDSFLLEEIGNGSSAATEKLNQRRLHRGLSHADLKAAKESAERTGYLGEELLDQYFKSKSMIGLAYYEWVAQINAVSPFDFSITMDDGTLHHVDAKSSSGKFTTPIYISIGEIKHALSSGVPYSIFRLYDVNESGATLRIAWDIRSKLDIIFKSLSSLPQEVMVDSLSFEPTFFDFDESSYDLFSILGEYDSLDS